MVNGCAQRLQVRLRLAVGLVFAEQEHCGVCSCLFNPGYFRDFFMSIICFSGFFVVDEVMDVRHPAWSCVFKTDLVKWVLV